MENVDDQSDRTDERKENNEVTESDEISGIELYPERRGKKINRTTFQKYVLGEDRDNLQRIRCERRVYNCVHSKPLIKLMLSAMKSAGCEFDLQRHISCEPCGNIVTGGYDPELNQIVVCQNTAKSDNSVQGVLAHEMVHMFDFCRANINFKNIDHLACTEIRAANLVHCSFMGAVSLGTASMINIKQRHQECVKAKALASIIAARGVPDAEAKEAIDRVFSKCYNDLEPVGRRLRRNSYDQVKAYRERYHYDYVD